MKSRWLGLVLAAAMPLAWSQANLPDRAPIDVRVSNGNTVVDEEVAYTSRSEGALVWRIVTAGYRFPADGVVIDSGGRHRCAVISNGRMYRCLKIGHAPGERYKYVVNLVDAQNNRALEPLDPWIQND